MSKGKLHIFAGFLSSINNKVQAGYVNNVTSWGFNELYKGEMTFVEAQAELERENYDWMQIIETRFGKLVVVAEFVRDIGWKMVA
jgi:hypothetical protein